MITRSHYQIRKNKYNWTSKEIKRWNIMKKLPCFKALVAIYNKQMDLYNIYEKKINKEDAIVLMKQWIKSSRRYTRVPEILHISNSIEKKLD
jgi:hypothetical protein